MTEECNSLAGFLFMSLCIPGLVRVVGGKEWCPVCVSLPQVAVLSSLISLEAHSIGRSVEPGFNPVSVALPVQASDLSVAKDWARSLHLCPCDHSVTLQLMHLIPALNGMGLALGGIIL